MPPEYQEKALECYVLICLNHSIALQSTAYFANESKVLAEALEELDLSSVDSELAAACEHNMEEMGSCETTTVSQFLRAVSNLFASHGDCGSYPLNEYEPLVAWIRKRNDSMPHLPPFKLEHLPSFKGSRMHILLELAESIALNREIYLDYVSTLRAGTKENKLVSVVWKVLSEAPVFNAILNSVPSSGMAWFNEASSVSSQSPRRTARLPSYSELHADQYGGFKCDREF
jgi:hypothetical protein